MSVGQVYKGEYRFHLFYLPTPQRTGHLASIQLELGFSHLKIFSDRFGRFQNVQGCFCRNVLSDPVITTLFSTAIVLA